MHLSIIERCALALCAAWLVAGSTAQADQILIGRDRVDPNKVAAYRRTGSSGPCDRQIAAFDNGYWTVSGSPNDDVIVVHDSGTPIRWCGRTIDSLFMLPGHLTVKGMSGADVIWGGNGGGMDVVSLYGGSGTPNLSDKGDLIFGGFTRWAIGGNGDDVIFLRDDSSSAEGELGNDLFCTAVTQEWSVPQPLFIFGDEGDDRRWGPAATAERVEIKNDPADQARCDFGYAAILTYVFGMLNS